MAERRRPIDKRLAGGTGDKRGKFLTKTFKKKPFVFEFGGFPGSPSVERECGGVALAGRPAEPCHHPVPSCELCPAAPAGRSSPRSQARFCPQFHSRVTDSTLAGATSCRSTGHTAATREGRAVFIVVFFVSFHPGEGRGWPRSQCPRSTSVSLTSPHGRRREAFPRAELGGRHAPSPGAAGRAGARHAGTCSPPPAGGAGVRGLGPPGSGEVRKGAHRAGAL